MFDVNVLDGNDFSNVSLFADETTRRSAKRRYNPPLASRGALWGPRQKYFGGISLRPRKLDVTLSKHWRSARRVAFLP